MHFVDIAANLTDDMYTGCYNGSQRHEPDMQSVFSRARKAGVVKTLVTSGTIQQSRQALELCKEDASLFSTVGIHPTRANTMLPNPEESCEELLKIVCEGGSKVVAIGECGLDYDRLKFSSKENQMPGFLAQFAVAEKTGLPMFFHDRNTAGDFGRAVAQNRARFSTGVVHSFTGTLEEMQSYIDMNLYIGINGCSLKTEENLRVAAAVPLDKIMLETDCPYCEVRPSHSGYKHVTSKWPSKDKRKHSFDSMVKGRNEPCQIRHVCEVLAAASGKSEDEVARAAFNNTIKVFFPEESKHMSSSPYDWSLAAVSKTAEP